MRAFTLVVCLAALVLGTSASTLKDSLIKLIAGDDLVTEDVMATAEDGTCKCCNHGCFCTGDVDGMTASVVVMLDELHKSCKCHARIVTTFMVNKDIFERIFPVNKDRTFCHTSTRGRHCFNIDVKDPDSKGQEFMHGCVEMTYPKKFTVGCFNLPLVAVSNDAVAHSDMQDDADVIDNGTDDSEEPYLY